MTNQMLNEEILVRASGAGNLMVGGTGGGLTESQEAKRLELINRRDTPAGITESQGVKVAEYLAKKSDGKSLTKNQEEQLSKMIAKRDNPQGLTPSMKEQLDNLETLKDKPFELGKSAKSFIEMLFLQKTFGYRDIVETKEITKGRLCEQNSMALVTKLFPDNFRSKNTERKSDEFFTGEPDIVLADTIEDVKTSWTVKTFFNIRKVSPLYYAQGQVYMHLFKKQKFNLHFCLVNTPHELVSDLEKSLFFKFGCDEDNKDYQAAIEQLHLNHYIENRIPPSQRIKTFSFAYDQNYIIELQKRAKIAFDYYSTLSLNMKAE